MSRPLRNIFLEIPYHITQRGNYRQRVFFGDADYQQYLDVLWSYASRYGLEIWAYCLMPNHIHIIAVLHAELAMARTFGGWAGVRSLPRRRWPVGVTIWRAMIPRKNGSRFAAGRAPDVI